MSKQLFGTDGIRGIPGEYPLDDRTSRWQPRILVRRVFIALDLVPEAARRSQSQIEIIGELGSTLACPLAQISFGLRLQAPGDPAKQMGIIPRPRLFSKQLLAACLQGLRLQLA